MVFQLSMLPNDIQDLIWSFVRQADHEEEDELAMARLVVADIDSILGNHVLHDYANLNAGPFGCDYFLP